MGQACILCRWGAVAAAALLSLLTFPSAASEAPADVVSGRGPEPVSIDRLAFGPDGVLFIADSQGARIYAVDIDRPAEATAGVQSVTALDRQVAALMGSDSSRVYVTDLAIDPRTGQAYVGASRGSGESGLFRIDGAGRVTLVSLKERPYAAVALPNPRPLTPGYPASRDTTITAMAFDNGRLYVAGLSNEEFASKLRAIPYPFRAAGRGASVEIYHTTHGEYETRSPVYTLLPMRFNGVAALVAAYICTPLVRLPESALNDGAQVRGETLAEMGRHNRPLDMISYAKGGETFILMANSRRGLLRLPAAALQTAPVLPFEDTGIDTHDLGAKPIRGMANVEQIALVGADRFAAIQRQPDRSLDLQVAALP